VSNEQNAGAADVKAASDEVAVLKPVADPAKVAKAHDIYEKTVANLAKAKTTEQAALAQLRGIASSTFQVGAQHYQIRERKDTGLYLCKLEAAPKGRPKGKAAPKPTPEVTLLPAVETVAVSNQLIIESIMAVVAKAEDTVA